MTSCPHEPLVDCNLLTQYFARGEGENESFKTLIRGQTGERYSPYFEVAKTLGLSSKLVSKLTSRVMANGDRSTKVNIGLSVKFEAKALKVIGYSRKTDRYWEFSQSTVDLIREYKVIEAKISNVGMLSLCL